MWNFQTALIRDNIYYSLVSHGMLPDEQNGYHKRKIDLLYIDQHIFKERKVKQLQ